VSTVVTNDDLARLIEDAADGLDGVFTDEYSGRGMYGKTCVGVEFEDTSNLIALGIAIAYNVAENALLVHGADPLDAIDNVMNDLQNMRWDNMGTGIIVYWPRIITGGN
jgi:hypothetical protein